MFHEFQFNSKQTLIYRDGILISGSLDALIQHMVPTDDYMPERQFTFAFLLSARLFLRPHQLLERICAISDGQRREVIAAAGAAASNASTSTAPAVTPFAGNFVRLLVQWVDDFPYDFRDERLMQHVRRMTQRCIQLDTGCRRAVSAMLQTLLNRLTSLDQYEMYLNRVNCDGGGNGAGPSSADGTNGGGSAKAAQSIGTDAGSNGGGGNGSGSGGLEQVVDITELCTAGPSQLAHQLTHIELERLSHIGAEEFVQAFVKENAMMATAASAASADGGGAAIDVDANASMAADIKKSRNLESYVQWFNRLSYLVASEIVKVSAVTWPSWVFRESVCMLFAVFELICYQECVITWTYRRVHGNRFYLRCEQLKPQLLGVTTCPLIRS